MEETMGLDLDAWKAKVSEYLKPRAPLFNQAGANLIYGLLGASALRPILLTDDDPSETIILVLDETGTGLIMNMVQGWKDKTDEAVAREILGATQANAELRQAMDELLLKLEVIPAATQELSRADQQWFLETLRTELSQIQSSITIQINTDGGAAINGNVTVRDGNVIGRDQITYNTYTYIINPPQPLLYQNNIKKPVIVLFFIIALTILIILQPSIIGGVTKTLFSTRTATPTLIATPMLIATSTPTPTPTPIHNYTPTPYCPGVSWSPRVKKGDTVKICTIWRLRLWDKVDGEAILFLLPMTSGTTILEIIDGPFCGEDAWWWEVKVPANSMSNNANTNQEAPVVYTTSVITGYVQEGLDRDSLPDSQGYFLCVQPKK